MKARATPTKDVRELLGMHTLVAWVLAMCFLGAEVLLAVTSWGDAHPHWPIVVALMLIAGAVVLLLTVRLDPLPLWVTAALATVPPGSAALVLTTVPVPPSTPAQLWPFGGATVVATFMCVRGRPVYAWIAMLAMIAVIIAWSMRTDQGWSHGVEISIVNLGPLLMSTIFAGTIRPAATEIFALGEAEARRNDELAESTALAQEFERQRHDFEATARDVFERLAGPTAVDAHLRQECQLLERHVRDMLSAPGFATEALARAARGARERGVEVSLEDNHGFDSALSDVRDRLMPTLIELLDNAQAGTIKIRSQPPRRRYLVTVVFDDPIRGPGRIEIGHDGYVLPATN